MKPTNAQTRSLMEIMKNINALPSYGIEVDDLLVMHNVVIPDMVYVKYNTNGMVNGERTYNQYLLQIDKIGVVTDINGEFENVYQRYAFLGDCKPLNLD